MLVTKESRNIHAKSQQQQQHMWDKNQLALMKYEEVYNQALVLTCISMKPNSHPQKLRLYISMISPNDLGPRINPTA